MEVSERCSEACARNTCNLCKQRPGGSERYHQPAPVQSGPAYPGGSLAPAALAKALVKALAVLHGWSLLALWAAFRS